MISYQTATIFIKHNTLETIAIRQTSYILCCMLGFIRHQLISVFLQSLIHYRSHISHLLNSGSFLTGYIILHNLAIVPLLCGSIKTLILFKSKSALVIEPYFYTSHVRVI